MQHAPAGATRSGTPPPVVIVAGPTASGKSRLALDVAKALDGTVINADSMQLYRELCILTARPSAEDEAAVPHRLYGVVPASEACSAGRWRARAVTEIERARAAGRLPIVVGGTGLYLKALTQGLAPVPEVPTEVRAEALALHGRLGAEAFHRRVSEVDPDAAARLPAGDTQRLVRAFEVAMHTGRSLSSWLRDPPIGGRPEMRFSSIILMPRRDGLYDSIGQRFECMIEAGAVDEVEHLMALKLDARLPAMKAVGVRELASFVRGDCNLTSACERAKQASRNYAKRQMTWLRHQIRADLTVSAQYSERLRPDICTFIRHFLLTGEA